MSGMSGWLRKNALWLVGLGLMLASSGLDGAYMSRWMSPGLAVLGYVLNTMSDITGMVLTYYLGVFQRKGEEVASRMLATAEVLTLVYSWLFTWRQLRFVLPQVESSPVSGSKWEVEVICFVFAGFIPLTLAIVGYAQALWMTQDVKPEAVHVKAQVVKPQDAHVKPQRKPKRQASSVKRQASGDKKARMDRLVQVFSRDPGKPITEVADAVGVSRTTVYSYLDELEEAGRVKRNGEGVKVL